METESSDQSSSEPASERQAEGYRQTVHRSAPPAHWCVANRHFRAAVGGPAKAAVILRLAEDCESAPDACCYRTWLEEMTRGGNTVVQLCCGCHQCVTRRQGKQAA